jgi:hypothetical protein
MLLSECASMDVTGEVPSDPFDQEREEPSQDLELDLCC